MFSAILSCSIKGAVTSSFCGAPFVEHTVYSLFYQSEVKKNEMVEKIALTTNKMHEEDLLAISNHSWKGAIANSFCREYFP